MAILNRTMIVQFCVDVIRFERDGKSTQALNFVQS